MPFRKGSTYFVIAFIQLPIVGSISGVLLAFHPRNVDSKQPSLNLVCGILCLIQYILRWQITAFYKTQGCWGFAALKSKWCTWDATPCNQIIARFLPRLDPRMLFPLCVWSEDSCKNCSRKDIWLLGRCTESNQNTMIRINWDSLIPLPKGTSRKSQNLLLCEKI